ncbi:hypothetical protein [Gimibacter soli]|uniref:Uncharacterized protein n=1 Tax=Gimibacter soli TaxID=3024400 RepID=A0AAE9XLD6_9PROT|nr:hypothetical protein [Gimibacter soli]WCL53052.1 hypothetical protein PH603_10925 [Gimibacter soli]
MNDMPGPRRELRQTPLVLIHQMGKVGSQALQAMLREEIWLDYLRRDHGLTDKFILSMRAMAAEGRRNGNLIPEHYLSLEFQANEAEATNSKLQAANANGDEVVIVAGFREPIGFILSNVFQLLSALVPAYPALPAAMGHLESYIEAVVIHVLEAAWQCDLTGNAPVDMLTRMASERAVGWWDHEWLGHHNLSWRDFEKVPDSKLWRFKRESTTFLVYRFEDGSAALQEVANSILLKPSVNVEENHSKTKLYAELYKRLKARLRIPERLAARYASLPYVACLYSCDERDRFVDRWGE